MQVIFRAFTVDIFGPVKGRMTKAIHGLRKSRCPEDNSILCRNITKTIFFNISTLKQTHEIYKDIVGVLNISRDEMNDPGGKLTLLLYNEHEKNSHENSIDLSLACGNG